MSGIAVRAMQSADVPAVVAMIRALAGHHGDTPRVSEASLTRDAFGAEPWVQIMVAERAGALVGYMALKRLAWLHYGDRGLEIDHLFVAPGCRKLGVGRALIAAARRQAIAAGCVELKVGTHPDNHAAQEYYLAQGFVAQEVTGARFRLYLTATPSNG